jgi:hypothetical protein
VQVAKQGQDGAALTLKLWDVLRRRHMSAMSCSCCRNVFSEPMGSSMVVDINSEEQAANYVDWYAW